MAARPIFVARATSAAYLIAVSGRPNFVTMQAPPASARDPVQTRRKQTEAGGVEKMHGDGRGGRGRFTATGLCSGRALGFCNLEGHRFMSADDGYLYLCVKCKGERARPRLFVQRRMIYRPRRPFAICPLESIRLRNF